MASQCHRNARIALAENLGMTQGCEHVRMHLLHHPSASQEAQVSPSLTRLRIRGYRWLVPVNGSMMAVRELGSLVSED